MATVKFEKATRTYPGGTTPAVDSIDLEIADGEFLVLVGTFTRYPVHAIIATFGIVLAALYILIPVQKALHGPTTPGNENLKDLNLREKLAIAPIIAIIVVLGFYPSPLLNVINPAASHVISQMGFTDPAPTIGGK